ncbi:MAG: malto-oligosyltrehalose synthase [Candidatus Binataceae bacterium]
MTSTPRATYRVQLHTGFGFDDAADIAEYLSELGVSHLYCSPYLQSAPGSTHGYDVVDFRHLNDELGGEPGHTRMCEALRARGLGQVLDVVSNHMAIGPKNPWWWDVLENGPSSNYAAYFDVDWDPPEARLRNTVLLPVLGAQYGLILESGEIQLARHDGAFIIRYHDHRFPVSPKTLDTLLSDAAARCGSDELAFIADALGNLPASTATDRDSVRVRHRNKAVLEAQLSRLLHESPAVAEAIDAVVNSVNSDNAAMHALLERQNYRLAYWRAAGRDLGYRRFFDIDTLVGLRMEDEQVFAETHALILKWVSDGVLDGLRIDHIDGLRSPWRYLERLRKACPGAWILVEKILESGEPLRKSWPIGGATGYDFLNLAGGLFIDPAGEEPFTRLYREFTAMPADFAAVVFEKKDLVMRDVLGSDLNRLTAMLLDICEHDPRYRDYTRHELHIALRAVAARFSVYRTYVRENAEPDILDERYVDEAVKAAKSDLPNLDPTLFDFLKNILLLRVPGGLSAELALRFQQFTGPVMAKAVEDTAFYCFNRLICLNEVGGDPARFGTSVEEFYRDCESAQRNWPLRMTATSTHDTKRSEDVRARLSLLSEIPNQWDAAVRRWSRINKRHWRGAAPDRDAEYLLYQTLAGAWPIETSRIVEYMEKAVREAKLRTSWTNPNPDYENRLKDFINGALADGAFVTDLETFVAPLMTLGWVNSLALQLIKLTAPGIPDLYQGSELWHFALVDPDNRRPVDYAVRRRMLRELERLTLDEIVRRTSEGMPKLWVVRQALALRKRLPDAFGRDGTFTPLPVSGERAAHVIAYKRGDSVIAVAPRLVAKLRGDWRDTKIEIPDGEWLNELTGERASGGELSLAALLARFPVCLLARDDA